MMHLIGSQLKPVLFSRFVGYNVHCIHISQFGVSHVSYFLWQSITGGRSLADILFGGFAKTDNDTDDQIQRGTSLYKVRKFRFFGVQIVDHNMMSIILLLRVAATLGSSETVRIMNSVVSNSS